MKSKFTILFLFITIFSYAQQGNGFSFGLNFSPNYDNFLFVGKSKEFFDKVKDYKKPHWGYTYGLTVKYMFNKHVGVETGALLTKKGSTVHYSNDDNHFNHVGNYFSTEIPLKVSYKIIDAKVACAVNLGVNFSFTNKFKGELDVKKYNGDAYKEPTGINYQGWKAIGYFDSDFKTTNLQYPPEQNQSFRNFNLIPNLSVAVSYHLTSKISIGLEPNFRFSLFNQSSDKFEAITRTAKPFRDERTADTSQIFWNVGLNSSVYFHF